MLFNMLRSLLVLAVAIPMTIFSTAHAQVTLEGDPKIAFIYFSQKNDGGWSEAHERGRQKTAADLGMDIAYVENVEETAEAVRQVVDLYLDRGFNIIVGTSYGFGAGLLETAKANPNIAFVNAAGDTAADNLETFQRFAARRIKGLDNQSPTPCTIYVLGLLTMEKAIQKNQLYFWNRLCRSEFTHFYKKLLIAMLCTFPEVTPKPKQGFVKHIHQIMERYKIDDFFQDYLIHR